MTRFPITDPGSIETVADWVELFILQHEEPLSKSALLSHVTSEQGEEPESSFMDDVWGELEYRLSLYGPNPPYEVTRTVVNPLLKWKDKPEYAMCLILSIMGNSEEPGLAGKLFERYSGEAIKKYVGGDVIIYGHPSKQKVEDVARSTGERYVSSPTSNFKDRGLDVVAWKSFGDARGGQIALLIQCAAGANWRSKLLSVPYDAWTSYILWGCKPLKGVSLPCIVPKSLFEECSYDAGVIFDRARLYVYSINETFSDTLKQELINWCEPRMNESC